MGVLNRLGFDQKRIPVLMVCGCGSESVSTKSVILESGMHEAYVTCDACGTRGPAAIDRGAEAAQRAALSAWNRRRRRDIKGAGR